MTNLSGRVSERVMCRIGIYLQKQHEMIVVHPNDPSTKMLSLIYEDIKDVTFFDSRKQREEILMAIAAAPREEPILLLGHGCPNGLLDMRYGLVIKDEDAGILKDRPNLVGIWCYASSYAYHHGLKGFFSGMFISEEPEAWVNEVNAEAEEIDEKAWDFAGRFGDMLREGKPLQEIAAELMDSRHQDSALTRFNYERPTWRPTGKEPLPAASEEENW